MFGQKRGDIFKFTIFVQKSVRIKKLAPFNKNGKLCKTKCSTVKSIKLGCARTCPKHLAQPCCRSKLASTHTAPLSFCFQLPCAKHRAQLSCCSKFASKHSAQPSFCLKLARIVRMPKPVKNAVHNFPVARNWPQITLRNCRFA